MKRLFFLMSILFCNIGYCQTECYDTHPCTNDIIDTTWIFSIKNKDFKLVKLYSLGSNTSRIEIFENDSLINIIHLPIPDEDVKNFGISDIKKTTTGFVIIISWGGGAVYYENYLGFLYKKHQFYLIYTRTDTIIVDSRKAPRKRIKVLPAIPITNDFKIEDYLYY